MASSGVLLFPFQASAAQNPKVPTTLSPTITPCSSVNCSSSSSISSAESETQTFSYSRASPSVRWPHLKLKGETHLPHQPHQGDEGVSARDSHDSETTQIVDCAKKAVKIKKMNKLELKRARDWRERVRFLTDRILALKSKEFVADVLDNRLVQMTPTDFCFVVKWVGQSSWQRALEVFEWLNLRHWYSPNARMLATILSVLSKANQESLAVEIFMRAEPGVGNTVQVYNAMMGVYARNGRFNKVQELLEVMRTRGCEPDLVSFNTLINARTRSSFKAPEMAVELLNEVRRSGLKPDIITYNTLISACSRESYLEEAEKVYNDMMVHRCLPDLWTFNAMISVYGRCGFPSKAEQVFKDLASQGFAPDVVTYNSLLYAFAKEGNILKAKEIYEEMLTIGFGKDEMTYNTIIHMYGKQGQHDMALHLYEEMKSLGRNPDAVTYAVLIDVLGKANRIVEAAELMSEMLDLGVKPTLQTFSALISGYAKAGKSVEAEETFHCMLRSGIRPDHLAYSVMLDMFSRFNESKKAMFLYSDMIRDGFRPDPALYEVLLRVLSEENKEDDIVKIVDDMSQICDISPNMISSILVTCKCYDHAAKILKLGITQGLEVDQETLITIVTSYSSSGRHSEALDLLDYLRVHASGYHQLVTEAQIMLLCKTNQLDAALKEYQTSILSGRVMRSLIMFENLIQCCDQNELFAEASQVFSDMNFFAIEPSQDIYCRMVCIYTKMVFPETAHYVLNQAQERGLQVENSSVSVGIIEAYGKLKLWGKAESMVDGIKKRHTVVDLKVWNALLDAYAASGCYERARAAFNVMMKHGPSPTTNSINSLLRALIVDLRLTELYDAIQEFQDMGFKISKSSILLMLDAFLETGNIFEVKKIYHGMKAAGFMPTMHHYRLMIGLLCRGKRVQGAEAMVAEMLDIGLNPDLAIWNHMLKLYTRVSDFRKAVEIHHQIQKDGLEPDDDTYNTLISMYCRDLKAQEGIHVMHEMYKLGLVPKLNSYKSLLSACLKQRIWEQAEEIFKELQEKGCEIDLSLYHIMLKIFRSSGNHYKAERLLDLMKERGVEPSIATMQLLMDSYGTSGLPQEAEKVLYNLKEAGSHVSTLAYSSVIDAYLKNGDNHIAVKKLMEMKDDGPEPDHRIWTCFIRAASLSQRSSEAIFLLNALQDSGFNLPIRLLTEKCDSLIVEVDHYLAKLGPLEDHAALNFVNSLADLFWAFELRSKASWLFQLAIKRSIYHHDVFRVADKDWGADFRKLSAGSALVGLTLWLDNMQDASLQGTPESSKSVVLITGTAVYNMVSLNSTLKTSLWEMGSPFLPCKTRTGVLVAKGHSLRMWLKESPFCLDLELKDAPSLPEFNTIKIVDGCFMRRGLVPAFKSITESLGQVSSKKFARLALLSDAKREKAIHADMNGAKEKLEKMKIKGFLEQRKMKVKVRRFEGIRNGARANIKSRNTFEEERRERFKKE